MSEECRVDLHVKLLDEQVVSRAKARGLDALVYAPHFTRLPEIRRRAARFSDDDLLVVPARELFAGSWRDRTHVLAVGLDDPVPDFLELDAAMAELGRQDAAVLVPHPGFATVSFSAGEIRQYRDRVDAVEAYNTKLLGYQNRRAREVVAATDLPAFGSSYAHLRPTVGEAWTSFERRLDSAAALVAALQDGAPRRVERRSGLAHRLRGGVEFAHLAWENSWEKVDRLLLSGTTATHPRHPAYGGRFDDAAVY